MEGQALRGANEPPRTPKFLEDLYFWLGKSTVFALINCSRPLSICDLVVKFLIVCYVVFLGLGYVRSLGYLIIASFYVVGTTTLGKHQQAPWCSDGWAKNPGQGVQLLSIMGLVTSSHGSAHRKSPSPRDPVSLTSSRKASYPPGCFEVHYFCLLLV